MYLKNKKSKNKPDFCAPSATKIGRDIALRCPFDELSMFGNSIRSDSTVKQFLTTGVDIVRLANCKKKNVFLKIGVYFFVSSPFLVVSVCLRITYPGEAVSGEVGRLLVMHIEQPLKKAVTRVRRPSITILFLRLGSNLQPVEACARLQFELPRRLKKRGSHEKSIKRIT